MGAVPSDIDTERGPTTTVPIRHFLVGLALLGGAVFAAKAISAVRRHSPGTLARVALGRFGGHRATGGADGREGVAAAGGEDTGDDCGEAST